MWGGHNKKKKTHFKKNNARGVESPESARLEHWNNQDGKKAWTTHLNGGNESWKGTVVAALGPMTITETSGGGNGAEKGAKGETKLNVLGGHICQSSYLGVIGGTGLLKL